MGVAACSWSCARKGAESLKEVTLRTFPQRAGFAKMEFESPVPEQADALQAQGHSEAKRQLFSVDQLRQQPRQQEARQPRQQPQQTQQKQQQQQPLRTGRR